MDDYTYNFTTQIGVLVISFYTLFYNRGLNSVVCNMDKDVHILIPKSVTLNLCGKRDLADVIKLKIL